jgi:GTP cyclohydrolase FolE2
MKNRVIARACMPNYSHNFFLMRTNKQSLLEVTLYNVSSLNELRRRRCQTAIGLAMIEQNNNFPNIPSQVSATARSLALPSQQDLRSIQDKSFVDIPASTPKVKLAIPQVGIRNRPCYVHIADPFSGHATRLYADLKVLFALPATQRGVHMSRIEECLSAMETQGDLTLCDWMRKLSNALLSAQALRKCCTFLDIVYEKPIAKNVSQKSSHELITLHSIIEQDADHQSICTGVTVPFINACPCTQRWAMREFFQELVEHGYSGAEAETLMRRAPLQAHTNLGKATLKIWSDKVNHQQIYDVLASAVPIVRELLKGVDEHALVSRAHSEGQFCEDNARAISQQVVAKLDTVLAEDALVKISVEVAESVHFHNLIAEIATPIGSLKAELQNQP